MDKTNFIKLLIKETNMSTKAFAEKADIPYTTLRSMLERGIENASVNNVIKICKELGICVETLYEIDCGVNLNKNEKELLNNYNKLNSKGKEKLLDYSDDLTTNIKYMEDNEVSATVDSSMPIAAHDDGLTDDEKDLMKKRIEEYEKNK